MGRWRERAERETGTYTDKYTLTHTYRGTRTHIYIRERGSARMCLCVEREGHTYRHMHMGGRHTYTHIHVRVSHAFRDTYTLSVPTSTRRLSARVPASTTRQDLVLLIPCVERDIDIMTQGERLYQPPHHCLGV